MINTDSKTFTIDLDFVIDSIPKHEFIKTKIDLVNIINIIETWNFSRVEKLVSRDYPKVYVEYQKYLMQYKYFLLLCVLEQSDIISVPNYGVDMIWHSHLIINRDYNKLTQIINNNEIIYHEPE